MTLHDAVVIGGGQSGLAAATALLQRGLRPTILEAGDRAVGSWPHYYDSLTLFSPARHSALPGAAFPGDPQRYPTRDDVVDYLATYANSLDADIRTGTRVDTVTAINHGYAVHTTNGERFDTRIVIAATGGFGRPHRPTLPGLDRFAGTVLHAANYRNPKPFIGQRVIVVGAGNSAVQIAVELADHANVTLATRRPVRFVPQRPLGRDVHDWSTRTGIDTATWPRRILATQSMPVLDTGSYRAALKAGRPERQPLWTNINDQVVTWPDGTNEPVDTILLATGYRPDVAYLQGLNALDESGIPLHRGGISTSNAGLGYVGLEYQRSLSSATIRGVHRDAAFVVAEVAPS
jgi:putative flavoprotein involved in K+ transport